MDTGQKRVLITGSSGMLGSQMVRAFLEAGWLVFAADRHVNSHLPDEQQFIIQLTNHEAVEHCFSVSKPDLIVHCAALVNLAMCEEHPELADEVHCQVTKSLVDCQKEGSRLFYISTDSVFDGEKGNYNEDEKTNPLNYYARSKRDGELEALRNPDNLVLRTNIYGFKPVGGKSLAEWLIAEFIQGNEVKGFTDTIFNPLYTLQLAHVTVALSGKADITGILNVSCKEKVSKYEFAQNLAEAFNYHKDMVKPAKMADMKATLARPLNTSLNSQKLETILGRVPSLKKGLEWLKQDYEMVFGSQK